MLPYPYKYFVCDWDSQATLGSLNWESEEFLSTFQFTLEQIILFPQLNSFRDNESKTSILLFKDVLPVFWLNFVFLKLHYRFKVNNILPDKNKYFMKFSTHNDVMLWNSHTIPYHPLTISISSIWIMAYYPHIDNAVIQKALYISCNVLFRDVYGLPKEYPRMHWKILISTTKWSGVSKLPFVAGQWLTVSTFW